MNHELNALANLVVFRNTVAPPNTTLEQDALKYEVFSSLKRTALQFSSSKKLDLDSRLIYTYRNGGNLIHVIKQHRTETNLGLKESKDYCEQLLLKAGLRVKCLSCGNYMDNGAGFNCYNKDKHPY